MHLLLKNFLTSKSGLRLMAGLMGLTLWSWMNTGSNLMVHYELPICFYEVPEEYSVFAPERIAVLLRGPRSLLHETFKQHPALHINAEMLHEGKNELLVMDQKIFLPDSVKLVNCSAHSIQVIKEKKV